ncbi:MAG: YfhO family protein [Clostridia bacterium]|nr:YfhO family protein [Clostridia bacterium]
MSAETGENRAKKTFYEKIKGVMHKLDGMNRAKAWLWAVLIFIVSLAFVMLPFVFRGTYTVWTGMSGDGATQFITFFEHMKGAGWLKSIGDYDFYIGLGADYLTSFSFYSLFDPFNLILFGLPFNAMANYTLTMACKQLACALTMFAYLRYKGVKNSYGIILSAAYMLSGFVAFTFVRHYNLAVGPIYLPLAIMGVDKLFNRERPYLFMASLLLCLVSNFYVFFSLSVFVVAYAIAYYFHDCAFKGEKKSVKDFFAKLVPIGAYYLLAVVLAGVVLLPNLYGYLHAARSGSKGVDLFNFTTFLSQSASLFVPMTGKNYSVVSVNLANAVLVLYALFKKDKRTRMHGIFVIVLTIGYVMPLFGYAMNIFNYSNNRWSYGLNFFVYVMIGLQSTDGDESVYDDGSIKKINGFFGAYLAILLLSVVPAVLTNVFSDAGWKVILLMTLSIFAVGGLIVGVYKIGKKGLLRFVKIPKKMYQPTVLFMISFALTIGYCFGYYTIYSSQHDGKERYAALFSQEERYIADKSKDGFFRGDALATGVWYDNFGTRGMNNGYYGTTLYNTIADSGVYEFLCENGVYNPAQNLGMGGLDGRYALQTLLSVKYSYDVLGQPYGFTKVDGYEYLYENKNYLPFGFMTDKAYSRQQYLALPVLERQYMLLDGVVLDGAAATAEYSGESKIHSIANIRRVSRSAIVSGVQEFSLPMSGETDYRGHEVYLVIKGVKDVYKNNTTLLVNCNGVEKEYAYSPKGNLMYSDQRDIYLNFGVVGQDVTKLDFVLSMAEGKAIEFDGVEIQALPVAQAQSSLDRLAKAAHLESVQLGDKGLKGTLTSETDGYLVLTLPYSEGWTAYVDGVETEILQADTAFMALKIKGSDGVQNIELRYETPYLEMGKAVSFVGIGGLGCVILGDTAVRLIRKKKNKEQGDDDHV